MFNSYDEPKPNAIFRNQPSSNTFRKNFEDPEDPLFRTLNEIDPFFLQSHQIADKRGFENLRPVDPRNKQPVTQVVHDFRSTVLPTVFHSPRSSRLKTYEHLCGIKAILAQRRGEELDETSEAMWREMQPTYVEEQKEFQKFFAEFVQTNKEQIFQPARMLGQLYAKWYARKAERYIKHLNFKTYNTQLGMPHVKVCREALRDPQAEICDIEIIDIVGQPATMPEHQKRIQFQRLHRTLESLVEDYISTEEQSELQEQQMKTKCLQLRQCNDDLEMPKYFMPLQSLLFLLCAGDYCDLSTEMLLDIQEVKADDEQQKIIVMQNPLPSRNLGWHCYNQIVEQATHCLVSHCNKEVDEKQIDQIKETETAKELVYKIKSLEDYMSSCNLKNTEPCQFSTALSQWHLKAAGKETMAQIYTIMDSYHPQPGPFAIKLEYNSSFGCEVLTKYELLKEWFKLTLQQQTDTAFYRLDINNFQLLEKERLSLEKLEAKLKDLYSIRMPQLLSNLYEFLILLASMPSGHYMLRFNPKFSEKILLCKPSEELAQSTVHIRQLLTTEPSSSLFMTQSTYLPIANDMITPMHYKHKLLPCTFQVRRHEYDDPSSFGAAANKGNQKLPSKQNRKFDNSDSNKNNGAELKKNQRSVSQAIRNKLKRKRRAERRKAELKKAKENQGHHSDMEVDKLLCE